MDIRPLSPDFAVSPQITVAEVAVLAEAGFTHVICNRPAFESAPEDAPDAIKTAVEAAGIGWTDNPLVSGQLTLEHITAQKVDGKVLAYCASGTRSAILWALSQAGEMPTDDIMDALTKAGYPLEGLRGQIEMLAQQKSAT
ncbi:MAG: protein tyrosine phosphatase family protein [Litoreibacter sp.]|nr:protein tyrosine phosphatase family protein [Litoreibacter sp.]